MANQLTKISARWQRIQWLPIAVGCIFVCFGLLGGAATGLLGKTAVLFFASLLFGVLAFMLPIGTLVNGLYVVSFLVVGQLIYFARIDKALWIPFLIGAVLFVRFPLDYNRSRNGFSADQGFQPYMVTLVKGSALVYFFTLCASSIINQIDPLQLLVSGKEYFFLWSLLLIFSFGLLPRQVLERIWASLPWVLVIQIPFILYQRFVVAPQRAAGHVGAEWDAIVGVFGGDPQGGGASGAMGVFCVVALAAVVARWRQGLMSGRQAALFVSCGLLAIGLAEVKFAVVLVPIAFLVLYFKDFRRKPLESAAAVFLGAVITGGVLLAYKLQYDALGQSETVGEYVESIVTSKSNDADFVNAANGEMGRKAAIVFWWRTHDLSDPVPFLIGHGPGASRVGDMVMGSQAMKWKIKLARSSAALLLWEAGLLGFGAVLLLLTTAFIAALRFSSDRRLDASAQATCSGVAVMMVCMILGLPYNTDFIYQHQVQLMAMLGLGYLAHVNGLVRSVRFNPLTPKFQRASSVVGV